MAVTPTYPGVYIDEISSGVRTISGVATSVTAFIGRTQRGPTNEPVRLDSFADFERSFGGLWSESPLTYAVRDYFLNGGGRAVVVRLYHAPSDSNPGKSTLALTLWSDMSALNLEARTPGRWGDNLDVLVDSVSAVARPSDPRLFDLRIREPATGALESFRSLSVDPSSPRFVKLVLENESLLVRVSGDGPAVLPPPASGAAAPTVSPSKVWIDFTALTGSDGVSLIAADYIGSAQAKTGLYALDKSESVNLLCVAPPDFVQDVDSSVWAEAASYAAQHRALLIIDPKESWSQNWASKRSDVLQDMSALVGNLGDFKKNAALYFPRLLSMEGTASRCLLPCGAVAGIIARTDSQRGVWKAPAGVDASLVGAAQLSLQLTDAENGDLNQLGINCLRSLPAAGRVVWGARTVAGNDATPGDWKYVPVRRLALYIEESLYRGTQWVVFEPNDEPLWAQIRLNVGSFMQDLFRRGAFAGKNPKDAFYVVCDSTTTTALDMSKGIVNILVGFAPLKPAEFVIVKLQQIAGQLAT